MSSIKPKFPQVSTQEIQSKLDKLSDSIRDATVQSPEGNMEVDFALLEEAIEQSGDASLLEGFEALKDEFTTYQAVERVDTACGGTYTYNQPVTPESLDPDQVKSVFTALAEAKARVASHLGSDGVLSKEEAKKSHHVGNDLAGNLAEDVIYDSVKDYNMTLREWREVLSETHHSKRARERLDDSILDIAEFHAATDEGAEAIIWAFRAKATAQDGRLNLFEHTEQLQDAETSLLRFIPFVGSDIGSKENHLSNREICKYLGTDDLSAFVAEKKAEVESQVGDYEAYLDGKDLPNVEQLNDPDFYPIQTSCG